MPRAFLIARRRYNGTGEFEETGRDYSPERGVHLGEYKISQQHAAATSDGASECGSESSSSDCPDELYNLTKLAEVSLAAAAGTLVVHHPVTRTNLCQQQHQLQQLPHQQQQHQQLQQQQQQQQQHEIQQYHYQQQPEMTRIFLERIEAERESLVELQTRRVEHDERLRSGFDEGYKSDTSSHASPPTVASMPSPSGKTSPTNLHQSPNNHHDHHHHREQSPLSSNGQHQESEEHECPDCGKKYSTSSNLARHRQTHRSLGDKKARRCPHCDKVYVSIPAYSMHVRTHNQGCKCHYCGKCFSRPWLLQGHIRTHTGEKPFKCTICNKAFADKSNLRAHIQTHSSTKPHICSRCGKAFALKSYLYKHEESSCMRSHNQSSGNNRSGESKRDSPATVQQTSSPTSVIVPPRQSCASNNVVEQSARQSSAFSAIIRHTASDTDRLSSAEVMEKSNISGTLMPTMVIRTSVISPNPEHLRFGEKKQQQGVRKPFDFDDPTRVSAFSRPQPTSITLNLAIA